MKDDPNNSPNERVRVSMTDEKFIKNLETIKERILEAEKQTKKKELADKIELVLKEFFQFVGYSLIIYSFMYVTGIVFSLAWNNLMAQVFKLPELSFTNGFCAMLLIWLISRWFIYPGKYKIGGKN